MTQTIAYATLAAQKPEPAPPRGGLSLRELAMPLALVAICAYFEFRSPAFLQSRNLSFLAIEASITGVLALGMFLIILPGHIDLSAGSGVALIGAIAAVLVFQHAWPAPLALLVAAAISVVIWSAMGTIIVKERVPSFIITLGGLLAFRGVQELIINDSTIPVTLGSQQNLYSILTTYYLPPIVDLPLVAVVVAAMGLASFLRVSRQRKAGEVVDGELAFMQTFIAAQFILLFVLICNGYRGLPLPAVVLGTMVLIVHILTRHTPYGRYLYAIGGNEEAAIVSGIPVNRVAIGTFAVMGLIVAITGFLQTAYGGYSTPTVGSLMELDAIAACVIGGTSLKGGRGTVVGVLMGVLIMAALLNGMTLLAVPFEIKLIARGLVLALAVWADVKLGKK
jgi:D-xylose transport system permease protein